MAISAADLDVALRRLKGAWEEVEGSGRGDWQDVRVKENFGTEYLRVTRLLPSRTAGTGASGLEDDPVEGEGEDPVSEDDNEALHSPPQREAGAGAKTVYEIIHSPSYRVPVLYISISRLSSRGSGAVNSSPEDVYNLLVPHQFKPQVEGVGVMGALSMTDHPITGLTTYFVHPCRTQEAMRAVSGSEGQKLVAGRQEEKPELYLMRWLGVIGASVGLVMPVAVAQALEARDGELGGC